MSTFGKALRKFKQICAALPKISIDYAFELGYNQGREDALKEQNAFTKHSTEVLPS